MRGSRVLLMAERIGGAGSGFKWAAGARRTATLALASFPFGLLILPVV